MDKIIISTGFSRFEKSWKTERFTADQLCAKLSQTIGVTDAQLEFVKNSQSGTGLIKCGTTIVPFDDRISKDCELYDLYNTNIHEKIRKGQMAVHTPTMPSNTSSGWLIH